MSNEYELKFLNISKNTMRRTLEESGHVNPHFYLHTLQEIQKAWFKEMPEEMLMEAISTAIEGKSDE